MSREVRRVALDFDWPPGKVWEGYLRPDRLRGEKCDACNGSGQTHFGWWLQKFSYLMGMLADDVRDQERGKPMHPWLVQFPRPHGHFVYPVPDDPQSGPGRFHIDRPSPDAVEFFAKLMNVAPEELAGEPFGRDPGDVVMRKLLEITGVDVSCQPCEGHGSLETYPGQRADADAWEPYGPPAGEGWQLWETVTEGSPLSPVFDTADGLASWMADPDRGEDWLPEETARKFVAAGWAPTAITTAEYGVVPGAEHAGWNSPE
ncbi:hypothetical protein [Streptomyces nanshensis]|uniref:hypothetical protein n=1 Tax=Streptomyces nanshensis TaxID=518642 RepID=UPI00085BE607|nr:hypothetical protein [Streptomyces nanshensis]